jgi:hypothetical protein
MKFIPMKSFLLSFLALSFSLLSFSQLAHQEGEILAQLEVRADVNEVVERLKMHRGFSIDLKVEKQLSRIVNIYQFSFNPEAIDENLLLEKFKKDDQVVNAQFNHLLYRRETIPNDEEFGSQWHHVNDGTNGGTEDADIDTDLAWDITTGGLTGLGDTIVVCVIEGGNVLHDDLAANAWFNYGEIPNNGIDDDANSYVDDYQGWNVQTDEDSPVYSGGHGTNVMGMIGAVGNNEIGMAGANWNVKIMSVAGESIGDELNDPTTAGRVVQAYEYVLVNRKLYNETDGERGAFIVATNASWGLEGSVNNPFVADEVAPLWNAVYDSLGVYGVLNCGATSNQNLNIDLVGDLPTSLSSNYMVSVTATNSNDVRDFSAVGATTVDLGAPGSGVFTTSGSSGYTSTSGTSFASPLTAGVIALMYSSPCEEFAQFIKDNPQGAADYVRYQLLEGTDPIENLVGETVTGGRLNAYNSIQRIMDNCAFDQCLPVLGLNSVQSEDTIFTFTFTTLGENLTTFRFRETGAADWIYVEDIAGSEFVIDTLGLCREYEFQGAAACQDTNPEDLNYSNSEIIFTSGCCVAPEPEEVSIGLIEEEEVFIEWETAFGIEAYNVSFRLSGEDEWVLFGTFEDGSALVSGLDSCAFYDFRISPSCDELEDIVLLEVRTKGCGNCIDLDFCPSFSNNSNEEHIESVVIGDFTNESGNNGGYILFEDSGLELNLNETYEVLLTPGFALQSFQEFWRVWLDMNQDGEFTENEIMISSVEGSSEPLEGSITIPEETALGNTRLRIAMKYVGGNTPDNVEPCENYGWGETEDYCLTVTNVSNITNASLINDFNIFPNPTKGNFEVMLDVNGNKLYFFEIIDITGRLIQTEQVFNGRNQLQTNTGSGIYIYRIVTNSSEVVKTGRLVLVK